MSETPKLRTFHPRTRERWRAWLEENHERCQEIWVVFYKAHTGKRSLAYDHAVEEALCFGWIDSIVRRLDDERYAQKFTPRRPGSSWSASNRERVARLRRQGRMAPAGLRALGSGAGPAPKADLALAPELERELEASARAWRFLHELAPSYRRLYLRWIMSAARPATRLKRLREAIGLLEQGKKLGLK